MLSFILPLVVIDVAISTRDPPHEQWLAGLGQVLGRSSSSTLHAPHFHPREQLLTVAVGDAVVAVLPSRVFRQLGEVATWWRVLTSWLEWAGT